MPKFDMSQQSWTAKTDGRQVWIEDQDGDAIATVHQEITGAQEIAVVLAAGPRLLEALDLARSFLIDGCVGDGGSVLAEIEHAMAERVVENG